MSWHALSSENALYLSSARLDFSVWLEQTGTAPPVAFGTKLHLEDWSRQVGDMKLVPHGRRGRALRIHGFMKSGWYYDQIWAAKGYGGYRKLMIKHAFEGFDVRKDHLTGIDADHVVARTVLKQLPAAWVAVFPVPAVSNRPFGRIEKLLPKTLPNCTSIKLSPIAALKLFCGCYPKSVAEHELAMRDVRGQIMTSDKNVESFIDAMDRDMRPHLK